MAIHVVMASHNRRKLTIRCLESLLGSAKKGSLKVLVYLFDDGSSDGTAQAVKELLPDARITVGSGSAFWAAGMAAAEARVLASPIVEDSDHILWLNDDVLLDDDALERLLRTATARAGIVVGAVQDPVSGAVTYSGLRKMGWHPLRYERVSPDSDYPVQVESLNGNVVLVPVALARKLNGIEGRYSHAFADIDYGIRARQAGVEVWLAPGTVGTCSANAEIPRDKILSDWKRFRGNKGGGNFRSLHLILARTHPSTWPLFVFVTYSLWWIRQITSRLFHPRV